MKKWDWTTDSSLLTASPIKKAHCSDSIFTVTSHPYKSHYLDLRTQKSRTMKKQLSLSLQRQLKDVEHSLAPVQGPHKLVKTVWGTAEKRQWELTRGQWTVDARAREDAGTREGEQFSLSKHANGLQLGWIKDLLLIIPTQTVGAFQPDTRTVHQVFAQWAWSFVSTEKSCNPRPNNLFPKLSLSCSQIPN